MQTGTHKLNELKQLTAQAKRSLALLEKAEADADRNVNLSSYRAWDFGRHLIAAKDKLDHGQFMHWRAAAFPKVHERRAQRCQEIFEKNANATVLSDFNDASLKRWIASIDKETIRKFRYGLVPAKEREQLKGDKRFTRPNHHSSVVVECNKLKRRIETGLYKPSPEFDKDFEPFIQFMVERRRKLGMPPL